MGNLTPWAHCRRVKPVLRKLLCHALRIGDNKRACRRMCAGGSAHEKRQRVMRLVMQSNALKPFNKNLLGIIRCQSQKRK
ncbi:hypothetical protein FMJ22_24025 [Klebsiella michiganensis]|nr:hypothetical protein [Klebsiella michiganensis]